MVNWTKIRMIHSYLCSILDLRKGASAALASAPSAGEALLVGYFTHVCGDTSNVPDSQQSYNRSLEVEPREN